MQSGRKVSQRFSDKAKRKVDPGSRHLMVGMQWGEIRVRESWEGGNLLTRFLILYDYFFHSKKYADPFFPVPLDRKLPLHMLFLPPVLSTLIPLLFVFGRRAYSLRSHLLPLYPPLCQPFSSF